MAGLAAVGGLVASDRLRWPIESAGQLTLGSNYSDEVPRRAMRAVVDAFSAASGLPVRINTVQPQAFQDRLAAYLQATPDDVFTWFAGNRMRFFAERGLASDVSDVWDAIGHHHSPATRAVVTGADGRQYLVPFITYPWVIIHRRSVWAERGYGRPRTLAELTAVAERMRSDGLVPFAFGDREGWPAMGTFDILDLRLNGYDFHLRLLGGGERWTDPRVRSVFEVWRELLPYHQAGALGRTWQEAARSVIAGEAGMIFLGSFAAEQATEAEREDLEMFPFPVLGTAFDAEMAIDAPVNGFMLSRHPARPAEARAFLEFVGSPAAQTIYTATNPSRIATALDADTSRYTGLQRRMAEIVAGAARAAQFFDRDTRPDFAGPNGMQALLSDFLNDPEQDLDAFLAQVQGFWNSLG